MGIAAVSEHVFAGRALTGCPEFRELLLLDGRDLTEHVLLAYSCGRDSLSGWLQL